eukprot:gene32052-41569_t
MQLQSINSVTCRNCSVCNANANSNVGDFIAVIPSGDTVIAASAFSSCSRLIGIATPTSVVSIDNSAFASCSSLKAVTILSTAIYIGPAAFYKNSNLTRINATSEICENVLNSCRGTCTQFRGCPSRSPAPAPIPANITCSKCNATPRYEYFTAVIPSGDSAIDAFLQCYLLVAVVVPTSVKSIETFAIAYCSSLKAVVILPTAILIRSYAFYGDSNLTRIDATEGICVEVLNSCRGSCTQFRGCPSSPSPAPAPGLSAGIIAAIVISTITAAVAISRLILWKCRSGNQSIHYGAVEPEVEMQSTLEHRTADRTVEAHALPQGEMLVSPQQVLHYPAAVAVVVLSTQQAVVVPSNEIFITQTATYLVEEVM